MKDFQLDPKDQKTIDRGRKQLLAKKAWDRMEAEVQEAFEIRAELPAIKGELAALRKAVERPVQIDARLKQPYKPKGTVKLNPIEAFATAVACEVKRYVTQVDVDDVLRDQFPGDAGRMMRKLAKSYLAKSASNPHTTTAIDGMADLVESVRGGWIESLPDQSGVKAIRAHGGRVLPLDNAQSVTYPFRTTSALGSMAGSFVGEGATIPVKSDSYSTTMFSRKKAAVITIATQELARTSVEDLRTILLSSTQQDTAQMLDDAHFDPTFGAVAGIRPASPWFGAANQPSGGTDLASIITDLSWLINSIDRAQKPLILMDPARLLRLRSWRESGDWVFKNELDEGTILGTPYAVSTSIPLDHLFVIDCADYASWLPTPMVDVSQTATLTLADDDGVAPTMADTNAVNDAGGSIHISDASGTTPATQVRSMQQTWSVALRMIQPVEYGMIRSGRTAYLTGVSW